MITRQRGNWGLSSGNTKNMVKSKLSLTYKTYVQTMCQILILLYYLLVVCTCVVAMVPKHINTMLCASVQVYSLRSKRFHVVSGKEWGTRDEDCVKNGASKKVGSGWERVHPSPPPPPSFIFWRSFHFSHGQNGKSGSSSFLGHSLFQNHTKILSNLLASVFSSVLIRSVNSNKNKWA